LDKNPKKLEITESTAKGLDGDAHKILGSLYKNHQKGMNNV